MLAIAANCVILLTPRLPKGLMPKISKTLIANTAPKENRFFLWDGDPLGFGLCIFPSGEKSYVFQYRTPQGRTRRMTLGKVTSMALDDARTKAWEYASQAKAGGNPAEQKLAERAEITVSELLDSYLESEAFKEKARSTRETDRGRIENHLKPLLGRKFARQLTVEQVKAARRQIVNGKTAKNEKSGWRARSTVTGGEGVARQAIRLLSAVYSWARSDSGLDIAHNPAKGLATGGDGQRKIVMRSADDYRRMFEALDEMEREEAIRPASADMIRLIALTGARRDEIAGLEWREVDLVAGVITIPPERHKSGRRTQRPRIIGLPNLAREIIARQPAGKAADLVFPPVAVDAKGRCYVKSRKGAPGRVDVAHPWQKVRARAQLPDGIGLHGLRHSLATSMAMNGAQAAQIATALGHSRIETSQRYIHWARDARAELAESAAEHISKSLRKKSDG